MDRTWTLAAAAAVLLCCGLLAGAPPKVAEEFAGKVVGVTDGDTIKVLVNKESVTLRLEGIDAPESRQSHGTKAKNALSSIVFGKTVTVRKTGTDRYGRVLGVVVVDGVDANAKLVEEGWAWHFKKYNDEERLAKLEETARKAGRGLWAAENPQAPWDFRAKRSVEQTSPMRQSDQKAAYWLNTSSGVRHNERCEHFKRTKKGHLCGPNEGKACGVCGG